MLMFLGLMIIIYPNIIYTTFTLLIGLIIIAISIKQLVAPFPSSDNTTDNWKIVKDHAKQAIREVVHHNLANGTSYFF
jgi:cadmium resistance protein CadD (predicted permease)